MALDLSADPDAVAIADSVARFCASELGDTFTRRCAVPFSRDLWQRLAELGVLALASEAGAREYGHAVAAFEALGRGGFPGPLAATFMATKLLDQTRAASLADGSVIVSLGRPPLMPWGAVADLFIGIDEDEASLMEVGRVAPVETLRSEERRVGKEC